MGHLVHIFTNKIQGSCNSLNYFLLAQAALIFKLKTMKKSVKKHIKEGSIIRTGTNEFWEVTETLDNKFRCRSVEFIGEENEWTQEFYYNIDMIVFNESGRNC